MTTTTPPPAEAFLAPSEGGQAPANERLKRSFGAWLWSSMIAATVAHFATFTLWPAQTATALDVDASIFTVIDVPPPIDIPPPPPELTRPAFPVVGPTDIDENVTIGLTTIEANPPDVLPPPPDPSSEGLATASRIIPFTVAPAILNTAEIVRAMERAYPAFLRDAGIGGTVHVLFHIDASGVVQEVRLEESSGQEALDRAALSVASLYRFSPALNRDQRVAVWVSFPIVFRVRNEAQGG